jgi:predicted AAA+ superfamily ATPase
MIKRKIQTELAHLLEEFPAVGVLGPRQVGKTTLAEAIAASINSEPIYLDLETPSEAAKLRAPEDYFELHREG